MVVLQCSGETKTEESVRDGLKCEMYTYVTIERWKNYRKDLIN